MLRIRLVEALLKRRWGEFRVLGPTGPTGLTGPTSTVLSAQTSKYQSNLKDTYAISAYFDLFLPSADCTCLRTPSESLYIRYINVDGIFILLFFIYATIRF